MNDDVRSALDELGRRPLTPDEAARAVALIRWVHGEPARLAAAREGAITQWRMYTVKEWEEDCQRRIAAAGEKMRAERDALQMRAEELLACTTAAEDYAKTVTVERDALRALVADMESIDEALRQENTTLRARVAELEADRERLEAAEESTLRQVAAEYHGRITAEAQVAAARAVCGGVPPDDSEDIRCFASEVLQAMDEASTTK